MTSFCSDSVPRGKRKHSIDSVSRLAGKRKGTESRAASRNLTGTKEAEPHVEISNNPFLKRDRCRGSSFGRRLVCIQTGQETSWSPAALAEARVGSRFKRKHRYFVEGNLIVILEPFPKLLTDGLLFLIGLTTRLCSLLCVVIHVDGLEHKNQEILDKVNFPIGKLFPIQKRDVDRMQNEGEWRDHPFPLVS
jgi:hypothetical protein